MDHPTEIDREFVERFLLLLAPFAPYMTEELYAAYFSAKGEKNTKLDSIHVHAWPTFDESLLVEGHRQMIIQVNGKTREVIRIEASKANNQEQVEQLARASARVARELESKSVRKMIFVPGKLLNFVTGPSSSLS
jgi:leucyl-tRNA synthetase